MLGVGCVETLLSVRGRPSTSLPEASGLRAGDENPQGNVKRLEYIKSTSSAGVREKSKKEGQGSRLPVP